MRIVLVQFAASLGMPAIFAGIALWARREARRRELAKVISSAALSHTQEDREALAAACPRPGEPRS